MLRSRFYASILNVGYYDNWWQTETGQVDETSVRAKLCKPVRAPNLRPARGFGWTKGDLGSTAWGMQARVPFRSCAKDGSSRVDSKDGSAGLPLFGYDVAAAKLKVSCVCSKRARLHGESSAD